MNAIKVQFYRKRNIGKAGRSVWRWRIIAGNGRKIAMSSEAYYNRKEAYDNFTQVTGRDPLTGDQIPGVIIAAAGWNVDIQTE